MSASWGCWYDYGNQCILSIELNLLLVSCIKESFNTYVLNRIMCACVREGLILLPVWVLVINLAIKQTTARISVAWNQKIFSFNVDRCWLPVAAVILLKYFWLWSVLLGCYGLRLLCLFLKHRLKELFVSYAQYGREEEQERCWKVTMLFQLSVHMCIYHTYSNSIGQSI